MSWRDDPVTAKQAEFIDVIADELGLIFIGQSKGEASDFLTEHYQTYRDATWQDRESDWAITHGYG